MRFLLFLLTSTPVLEVCTNNEVVMFQPRTDTSPGLCSVAIVNLITSLSRPTCFNRVLDIYFSLPDLTPNVSPSDTILCR